MMQILVLLGMYFAAVVVFVTSQTLLFRLALAILCLMRYHIFLSYFYRLHKRNNTNQIHNCERNSETVREAVTRNE